MPTFKLTVSYDGTNYRGWQLQPDVPTVQGVLETALAAILGRSVRVAGSSRTDTGVHAFGQVVSFSAQTNIPASALARAVNTKLPDDVRVLTAEEVSETFHAIGSAKRKRYRYVIHDGPHRPVFHRCYCWHVPARLDAAAMHRAAQGLVGRHDFRSFESNWPTRDSSVRTILGCEVSRLSQHANGDPLAIVPLTPQIGACESAARPIAAGEGLQGEASQHQTVDREATQHPETEPVAGSLLGESHFVAIEVEADGFLYNMVRAIVGTLYEVGRGKQPESWPTAVLAAQDRQAAGMTAPPQGLFLLWIEY